MTFLEAVNRVLRNNTILSGDDDDINTFSDLQHKATVIMAKQAIQATITILSSHRMLPVEETDATLTTVASQRVYDFPSDFIRMAGEKPFMLEVDASDVAQNRVIYEYPGGKERLEREVLNYREQEGTEHHFYFPLQSTGKKVALYQVPDAVRYYRYTYEKSVYPTTEADTLPFANTQEDHAFVEMASRYFQFLQTTQDVGRIEEDSLFMSAQASLANLLNPTYGINAYGYEYR